jgi:enoyl-CoA hydratase
MSGKITLQVDGAVGRIVIDRPEKHNAITPQMAEPLAAICRDVDCRDEIRVVILAGAGERAFSAGSDLNALAEDRGVWAFRNRVEYATVVRDIRKPVIASLRGWVLGGGLEIALSADIRIAGRGARLGAPEVKRAWLWRAAAPRRCRAARRHRPGGAPPAVGRGDRRKSGRRDSVSSRRSSRTARSRRGAASAQTIAAHSPIATQAVKAALRAAQSTPLEAGLRYENELHVLCMQSEDRREGIAAFQQKRDGSFEGR